MITFTQPPVTSSDLKKKKKKESKPNLEIIYQLILVPKMFTLNNFSKVNMYQQNLNAIKH